MPKIKTDCNNFKLFVFWPFLERIFTVSCICLYIKCFILFCWCTPGSFAYEGEFLLEAEPRDDLLILKHHLPRAANYLFPLLRLSSHTLLLPQHLLQFPSTSLFLSVRLAKGDAFEFHTFGLFSAWFPFLLPSFSTIFQTRVSQQRRKHSHIVWSCVTPQACVHMRSYVSEREAAVTKCNRSTTRLPTVTTGKYELWLAAEGRCPLCWSPVQHGHIPHT